VPARQRENAGSRARATGADKPAPPGRGRERGRERERAWTRAVAGRWGPPVRQRRRARVAWLGRLG
jgi:hypothetical protein